ncbi:TPA: TniQ family protein [Burkholderia aenigmatica]|nr:TniQ family protein [Burkholderia sp. AU45251]HDR9486055.1 TniQ family protein [Burkholderia aenigmatica]MDN7518776.1 TniQ family protein [Burkholderia sp. AU45251]HDR9517771.1 TniQ family protein [Burkholderia aenigmatica]HDR9595960.1 TniQ family protein [Burkholderia aenigmatica]HDR9603009.1 TniQ family protein [Burkholderia aenigmatica]
MSEKEDVMAVALKPFLEGETIFSNISRYADEVGLRALNTILPILFGSPCRAIKILPVGLQYFSEETSEYIGLDGEKIARQHTPYNYLMALANEDAREATMKKMLSRYVGTPTGIRGPEMTRKEIKGLRYCDECVAECRETAVELYYRVDQQLPGVYVCPKHTRLLRVVVGTETMDFSHSGSLATLASRNDGTTLEGLKPLELQAMADVARRSAHVLVAADLNLGRFPYREMLKEAGFLSKGGDVRHNALSEARASYFGTQFCWITGFDDDDMVRILLPSFQCASIRHPFKSIAFQSMLAYLASGEGTFRPRVEAHSATLNEHLICSGKLHRDADKFSELRFVKASGRYVTDCTCGVSVSLRVDGDGNVIDRQTVGYGRRYKAAFRELVSGGMNAPAAGREIGIKKDIAWFWKQEVLPGASQLSKSCRASLRAKWRACVESAPTERRLTVARKLEPNLWLKLQTYDRQWFLLFNSRHRDSRRRGDGHLLEIFARLDDARKLIAGRLPPEHVTRKALVAVARAELNGRLPGCHDVAIKRHLSTLAEGRIVFIDRLIDYWLERLAEERVVSVAQFSELGGFSRKRLTAAQKARIANWLSDDSR